MPAGGASSVACLADAVAPATLPVVKDNCGNTLTPSAPEAGTDPACGGTKTYTYTYTDCAGKTYPWTYTYTIAAKTPPRIVTCPASQSFCEIVTASYTIPVIIVESNNCNRTIEITYLINGVTNRAGKGNDASGLFNP